MNIFKSFGLIVFAGGIIGVVSAFFLFSLEFVTNLRLSHSGFIWLLPLAGIIIGYLDQKYGDKTLAGSRLLIEEIHNPKKTLPRRWVPMILFGTLATHLFGGSAGREGTAVQMGAVISDRVAKFFKLDSQNRSTFLLAGLGAGFASAVGAPWAGAIFGIEIVKLTSVSYKRIFYCAVAAWVAYLSCHLLGVSHTDYFYYQDNGFLGWKTLAWIVLLSAVFGVFAFCFTHSLHFAFYKIKKLLPNLSLRLFLGALVLVALYQIDGMKIYQGLGIENIQWALMRPSPVEESFLKGFFTVLTLGVGFKGGEFTPLVFMGASLGSTLSSFLDLPVTLFAALGFSAVFGAAANAPLACAVMAGELFGWKIFPYALLSCWVAYRCSGAKSIYLSHPVEIKN